MDSTHLISYFVTGLFAGALTCMAVQGGLLATTIAQRYQQGLQEKTKKTGNLFAITIFLLAKLLVYTLAGAMLGWLGSFLHFSITATMILQIAVGIFMLGTALHLLKIHPLFRFFILQPPYLLTKLIRKESKSARVFAPALLGALTLFIPCGTTQAMMALSVASGDPLTGAAILFAFTLGTSPLFFILGFFASQLSKYWEQGFAKIAAFSLIIFAIIAFNNALALSGSTLTLTTFAQGAVCVVSYCEQNSQTPITEATITITDNGYTPNNLAVKSGTQITLHLINKSTHGGSCTQAMAIPSLAIQKLIPVGAADTVTFTAPDKPGTKIGFTCSTGMYGGVINVI